jgi:hypothetical protein
MLSRFAISLGTLLLLAACQPPRTPERAIFDQGETAYRQGNFDLALERYEAFLKAAPGHQLAPLAQQRILVIERELEAVMGRKIGPRPIYLRPSEEDLQAASPPTSE